MSRLAGWFGLVSFLAVANYGARFEGGKPAKDALFKWETAIGGAVQFAVILGFALLIARGRWELLALRRPRSWWRAARLAAVVLAAVYALGAVLAPLLDPGGEQGLTPDRWDSSRAVPFFANAIVVCVLAPVTEELTFRGVGFGLIAQRWGADAAIVGSAVLFGLAHGLVEALPLLVAFGIGLAWLRERQDSTLPCIVLHGTFNAIALAASLAL